MRRALLRVCSRSDASFRSAAVSAGTGYSRTAQLSLETRAEAGEKDESVVYLFIFVLCMSPTPRAFGLHASHAATSNLHASKKWRGRNAQIWFARAALQGDGPERWRNRLSRLRPHTSTWLSVMNDRPSYRLVPSLGTYELMTIAPAQNVLIGRSAVVPVPPSGQLPTFYVRISDPTISKQHAHLALSADGTVLTLTDVSTNGTFVDGLRVPRGSAMELESGDVLSFATTDQQSVTLPFFKVMLVTKAPEPVSEPAPPPETHIDKRDSVSVENVAFTLTLKIGEVTVESAKAIGVATVDSAKAVGTATAGGAAYVGKKSLEGAKAFGDGVKATGSLVATGLEKTLMTLGVTAAFQAVFGESIDKSDVGLEAAFAKLDTNKSGKINCAEMKAYISSVYEEGYDDDTIIAEMMASADMNLDGEMDLDEFKIIMRSAPMKSDGALGGAVDATVGATVGGIKAIGDGAAFFVSTPIKAVSTPIKAWLAQREVESKDGGDSMDENLDANLESEDPEPATPSVARKSGTRTPETPVSEIVADYLLRARNSEGIFDGVLEELHEEVPPSTHSHSLSSRILLWLGRGVRSRKRRSTSTSTSESSMDKVRSAPLSAALRRSASFHARESAKARESFARTRRTEVQVLASHELASAAGREATAKMAQIQKSIAEEQRQDDWVQGPMYNQPMIERMVPP